MTIKLISQQDFYLDLLLTLFKKACNLQKGYLCCKVLLQCFCQFLLYKNPCRNDGEILSNNRVVMYVTKTSRFFCIHPIKSENISLQTLTLSQMSVILEESV